MTTELKALYGFAMVREFPYGARYKSESLNGLQVDVWASGKWGIVGRNVYGKYDFNLAKHLANEAKHVEVPKVQPARPRPKFVFVGLLKKPVGKGFLCVVESIETSRSEAALDMRIRDNRHLWSKKGYSWEVAAI